MADCATAFIVIIVIVVRIDAFSFVFLVNTGAQSLVVVLDAFVVFVGTVVAVGVGVVVDVKICESMSSKFFIGSQASWKFIGLLRSRHIVQHHFRRRLKRAVESLYRHCVDFASLIVANASFGPDVLPLIASWHFIDLLRYRDKTKTYRRRRLKQAIES